MIEFTLHPQVYSTGSHRGLVDLLEHAWVRQLTPGEGEIVVISGFGNFNGGVRFYETFRRHVEAGGRVKAIFGGSTSQRLTSKQVVEEMLNCGADVHLINRKRLLHAKCYGTSTTEGDSLIVTSGNFTGPGMSQNVESSVFLNRQSTAAMQFRWADALDSIFTKNWQFHRPTLQNRTSAAWQLLYDEAGGAIGPDETLDVTLLLVLGHADTVRIQAEQGSIQGRGSQYFWLSKDCYDFFPPLTIPNSRGNKRTFSCLVKMSYPDLGGIVDEQCRVTFEADNNLDFRLGTGPLRYTKYGAPGDLAAITRTGFDTYELRIFREGTAEFNQLQGNAITFIGHQGKRYGSISNEEFAEIF